VFIDGCFWHGCADHKSAPRSNPEAWRAKLAANRRRDVEVEALLQEQGWTVIRAWEHDDPALVSDRVRSALGRSVEAASTVVVP
jgi:DNA mismatch endonuclease (patch repair protein)